jgi:hypothetical protein
MEIFFNEGNFTLSDFLRENHKSQSEDYFSQVERSGLSQTREYRLSLPRTTPSPPVKI